MTLLTLTAIPTNFGSGGSGLTPNGSTGKPSLRTLLEEHRAGLATLDTALAAATATANAAMSAVKRTCTITQAADLAGLAGGVKTFSKNVGAAMPANARLLGVSMGEGTLVAFDDATHGTFGLEVGTAGTAALLRSSQSVKAGDIAAAVPGTAGAGGFDFAPIGTLQIVAKLTSSVDLNTATAGAITVNAFYLILA